LSRRRLDRAEQAARGRGLPAATLTDEAERLALVDVEVHAVDRAHVADRALEEAFPDRKELLQPGDAEQRRSCAHGYRKQLTAWPWPTGRSSGSRRSHVPAMNSVQRGWKGHPDGRSNGCGTLPAIGVSRSRVRARMRGIERSSARVYGCFGSWKIASTGACSTTRPRYITAT